VHRDVSSGNIIIKPTDDGSGTVGRLIDFDHAKVTEKFAPMKCRDVTDPSTVELHMAVVSRHQEMKLYMLHDDVMVKVLQVLDPDEISISKYIREVLNTRQRFFSFRSSGQLTSADLHWDMVVSITCNTVEDVVYNSLFRTRGAQCSQITKPEAVIEL
jgi:serine/threonine protein kinase